MIVRSQIVGCGSYLPERVVTNAEMARMVDTSDEWIVERTGIRARHLAADGQTTSDLATIAAQRALEAAGIAAAELDLLIVATATPDHTFPATATKVQARIGMTGGAAFDVQAVCSGFVYALSIADNFIKAGQAKTAMVIGAETFSRILDWTDRGTCVLFGDGAGAIVLRAAQAEGTNQDRGILSTHLHSDGRHHDLLYVDGGPSSTQTVGHLRMEGKEVFRHAVANLAQVVGEALDANGLAAADIDWVVPHQANRRILDGTARKLGLSTDRMVITVDRHANTSAASVPLAFTEAFNDGRLKPGQLVLLEAMGGGFTWGAALVRL
ncbi:3-oxoacyl-ACP synthase [Magnetospirillum moscoviense]|uniref:Beta-ketoacyl-[acyl-carrier-protein] synthase III n=1 Tax=Magnetospirillum moscoviense TaxID=1437059 RepID=A0A178MPR4_9PROT|nr:beta-ketoacyl-ACP synthase III [Magnetospirillum moscoviense]OAN50629.1 3-oxoacyl-ACP synthase [Magnetospirillum moscoviense]